MPGMDNSGPFGTGPVGRGLGPCGSGKTGWGRGNGNRHGYGFCRQSINSALTADQEMEILKTQKSHLESNLTNILQRIQKLSEGEEDE